ncbi:AbiJ-related protein, partial [Pseudomonas paraeruginosa]|uniref:AbiJ-related protein n=1 Tax=Pseudomonas paraeruginosa TaxID=2994495 RepID=UPI002A6AC241
RKTSFTSSQIPPLLERLGLSDCPDAPSKRDQLRGAVHASTDDQIVMAAYRALEMLPLPVHERDELQELVWDDGNAPIVPSRYRRELAQQLAQVELFLDAEGFHEMLSELWRVDDGDLLLTFQRSPTLRDDIQKHYAENNDWDAVTVFDKLGAFRCSDARFARFMEALASSRIRPDETLQRSFMAVVDQALLPCGVRFDTMPGSDGYLVGTLVYVDGGIRLAPKNLIFASSVKPDLRLGNALDNDVEVVTSADKVLIYDRPIGPAGLLWQDLQSWFEQTQGLVAGAGKQLLYRRLLACLPDSSPVQRLAFTCFYTAFPKTEIPRLPALLPEVWFHWDPQTVVQRGKAALLRSRMDFLLLLPGGRRVVIEVDGQHHYATGDGRASPKRYSDMMAADRSLRLAGYEVYRFGGYELSEAGAEHTMMRFYQSLFTKHKIIDSPGLGLV